MQEFVPEAHNVIPEGISGPNSIDNDRLENYSPAVRTMIVPSGVKGFCDDFFRGGAVTDIFLLPDSLETIGNGEKEPFACECVFADCLLPEVVIPESVRYIGKFCFGASVIEKLVIRAAMDLPYLRQFKDSTIRKLYLPLSLLRKGQENPGFHWYDGCRCEIIEY